MEKEGRITSVSSPPLVSRSLVAALVDDAFIALLLMRDVEKPPTQDDDTTASTKATFLANFIVQKVVTNIYEQSTLIMILRKCNEAGIDEPHRVRG